MVKVCGNKCRLFLFLILFCSLICCLGVVSASDISVSDIHDDFNLNDSSSDEQIIGNGVTGNVSSIGSNVSCDGDFKNVSNQFKNLTNHTGVIVNITNNINITNKGSVFDFNCENKTLIILGNGFNISVVNPNPCNSNHFLNCGDSSSVLMSDVRFNGFNTTIKNYGSCVFNNITFENNQLNDHPEMDYGGAIQNFGNLELYNSNFINNLAVYGGAIYSNGASSRLSLIDCTFRGNVASASRLVKLGWQDSSQKCLIG